MDFRGKRVLVTGGAKRIGAALVRAFAEKGACVVIHCNESIAEAEALAHSLPSAQVVRADLRENDCGERIFAAAPFDVLVNNASLYATRPLREADRDELETFLRVNFHAPLDLMQRFARQGRHGAIVNILDGAVLRRTPAQGAYEISRRALADATCELALEFAPTVRVNAVAPGPTLPPVFLPESRMEKSRAALPLRRTVAMDDLCGAVLFLARNESVTGAVLPMDCGLSLT